MRERERKGRDKSNMKVQFKRCWPGNVQSGPALRIQVGAEPTEQTRGEEEEVVRIWPGH